MDAVFAALTSGARFDRQRFGHQLDMFQAKKSEWLHTPASAVANC